MDAWALWIVLAVILAVGEIMTLGFFLAPFAAGALLGATRTSRAPVSPSR